MLYRGSDEEQTHLLFARFKLMKRLEPEIFIAKIQKQILLMREHL